MKIILVGKMGSGKDTVAEISFNPPYWFSKFAFAAKLKEVARELFPEGFENGNKPVRLLQDIGTKMREIKKDCWTDYVISEVESWHGNIVITDCRYLNELEIAKQHGFIPVRVVCDDEVRFARLYDRDGTVHENTRDHVSETELDYVVIEHVLENSGTLEELKCQVYQLISQLEGDK